jgi:hypothetical protein
MIGKGLLHRVVGIRANALDRDDVATIDLKGEHRAGGRWPAV